MNGRVNDLEDEIELLEYHISLDDDIFVLESIKKIKELIKEIKELCTNP